MAFHCRAIRSAESKSFKPLNNTFLFFAFTVFMPLHCFHVAQMQVLECKAFSEVRVAIHCAHCTSEQKKGTVSVSLYYRRAKEREVCHLSRLCSGNDPLCGSLESSRYSREKLSCRADIPVAKILASYSAYSTHILGRKTLEMGFTISKG